MQREDPSQNQNPSTSTEEEVAYRINVESYFADSVGTNVEKLQNFTKYVPRQSLARFISRYEIFKRNVQGSVVKCGVYLGGGLMTSGLLSVTDVMIGNSSSAAGRCAERRPTAVNVGTRQNGRERGGNLVDTGYARKEIGEAIRFLLDHVDDPDFRAKCRESPYHDVNSAEQIAEVLSTVELGTRLIQKRFYDGEFQPQYERFPTKPELV